MRFHPIVFLFACATEDFEERGWENDPHLVRWYAFTHCKYAARSTKSPYEAWWGWYCREIA